MSEISTRPHSIAHAQDDSGHAQQLPIAVDAYAVEKLINHHGFALQEGVDGERRSIEVVGGVARGINKLGIYVDLPMSIAQEMSAFGDAFFDGEQVGSAYYVFDLLQLGSRDLRACPFGLRYEVLAEDLLLTMHRPESSCIRLLEAAFTPQHKQVLLDRVRSANGDGVVFKDVTQPYEGGRAAHVFSFKFSESATSQDRRPIARERN